MCTSPIKAYLLDKGLIFQKIFEEKEFKNHYNEFTKDIVTDITTELYEKEGLCDKRYYKRISFKPPKNELANCYKMIELPCGKCDECRYKHAKMWSNRCYLETKYHEKSCFITLTYNTENLPQGRTLVKTDLQKFWKRLRKYLSARQGVRYFACGEYGPRTLRPHYHAIIWGWKPDDLKFYKKNEYGENIYTSKTLEKIWSKGFAPIEDVTYESCGYVARYTSKKLAKEFIAKNRREQEFIVMSRKPGIGEQYFKEHKKEIWEQGGIYIHTRKGTKFEEIPRYFMKKYKEEKDIGIENEWTWYTKIRQEKIEENKKRLEEETSKNYDDLLEDRAEKYKKVINKRLTRNKI